MLINPPYAYEANTLGNASKTYATTRTAASMGAYSGCNADESANNTRQKWSLVNHFIPFTEAEVGALDRFESDFVVNYLAELPGLQSIPHLTSPLKGKELSVLTSLLKGEELNALPFNGRAGVGMGVNSNEGLSLETIAVFDELKPNRSDVGGYQIRNALKKCNESGDTAPVDFTPFETAYKTLTEKLQPQVFELGFLW